MPVAFLVARQRSGTGALISILHHHSDIASVGEVFHPDAPDVQGSRDYFPFLKDLLTKDPLLALPGAARDRFDAYIAHLEKLYPDQLILIDAKYRSLSHFNGEWASPGEAPQIIHIIKERNIPVLHLTRKNFVATWVSGRLAEANRRWHARREDEVKIKKIRIDPDALWNFLQLTALDVKIIRRGLLNYDHVANLAYERLLKPDQTLTNHTKQQINKVLKLSGSIDAATPLIKQAPVNVRDAIENLSEIEERLKDTAFERMLAY